MAQMRYVRPPSFSIGALYGIGRIFPIRMFINSDHFKLPEKICGFPSDRDLHDWLDCLT